MRQVSLVYLVGFYVVMLLLFNFAIWFLRWSEQFHSQKDHEPNQQQQQRRGTIGLTAVTTLRNFGALNPQCRSQAIPIMEAASSIAKDIPRVTLSFHNVTYKVRREMLTQPIEWNMIGLV